VFIGQVVTVDTIHYQDTLGRFEYDGKIIHDVFDSRRLRFGFMVSRVFKGVRRVDTVFVITGMGHGDCGFPFVTGSRYLVYASHHTHEAMREPKRKRYLYTDTCTRTTWDVAAEVEAIRVSRSARNH
jgi:hypothetical protein